MLKEEDFVGKKFGKLTVLKLDSTKQKYKGEKKEGLIYFWLCQCECGNTKIMRTEYLGRTKSCGCLNKEKPPKRTHGMSKTKIYSCWKNMRRRCYEFENKRYKTYGGRGIKVCEEWQEFKPFYDWAMSNGYQEGLTIERIDVNGNYEPSNCTWITMKQQGYNTTRTHFLTYNDKTQSVAEWAVETGLTYSTLQHRLQRGWDIAKLLSTPQRNKND